MKIFDSVQSVNFTEHLLRNIVSIRQSQDLFDDLSQDPGMQALAANTEMTAKPPGYTLGPPPLINRPFEEACHRNVIDYPFEHLQPSRFSRGKFGVWYGALELETTIMETVYHWYRFLSDTGDQTLDDVAQERRVHKVKCDSHLLDFTPIIDQWPDLLSNDYTFTQQLGDHVTRKKLPGLISISARLPGKGVVAVFTPEVLSHPSDHCYLTYRMRNASGEVTVERTPGKKWLTIPVERLL